MSPDHDRHKLELIRRLNDELRTTLSGGRIMLTRGVRQLPESDQSAVIEALVAYTGFAPDDQERDQHDFGLIQLGQIRAIWKINYLDQDHRYASPDPSDPALTRRVLKVMLVDEI